MQSEVPLSQVAVRKVPASREALPLKGQENDPCQGKPTVPAGKLVHWKKPWRDWSKDSMELALKEVSEGSLTIRRAACSVTAKKGQKHVTALVSGNKTQITVLICARAAGNPIPPMVIFD